MRKFLTVLLSGTILLFAGCRSAGEKAATPAPEPPPPAEGWDPSSLEAALGGPDPIEGFNRSMFCCTDFLMNYVADPVGQVYTTIFPRPFIEHFNNACLNLEYPARCVSCLLRKEWDGAKDETIRFFSNSTLGLAGFFDVADTWWNIPDTDSDFGQTFAAWGFGPGCTFMLPCCMPINVRDMTGYLFDIAFDLKTYIPYAGSASALNRMVVQHRNYMQFMKGSLDPYKQFRQMMLIYRALQMQMASYRAKKALVEIRRFLAANPPQSYFRPAPPPPDGLKGEYVGIDNFESVSPVADSVRFIFCRPQNDDDPLYMRLSWLNRDFTKQCDVRKLQLLDGRPPMNYGFWKQPEGKGKKRRLMLLLPGIGGTYYGPAQTAFAELFYRAGYDVASFYNTFTWQFISTDSFCRLPGYLPEDAERLRTVIRAALLDLTQNGKIDQPEITVVGYSMGGMQALQIAELEEKKDTLGISRYVAINPPVSLKYALTQVDEMFADSRFWKRGKAIEELLTAVRDNIFQLQQTLPPYDPVTAPETASRYRTELNQRAAKYAAALSIKLSLRELLLAAHKQNGLPGMPEYRWGKRNELYRALDRVSFQNYVRNLLIPTYPGHKLEELLLRADLHALHKTLATSPKIRVLHNYDDFLLSEADRDYLDQTLGARMVWFSEGGHLGNFYTRPFQQTLLEKSAQ